MPTADKKRTVNTHELKKSLSKNKRGVNHILWFIFFSLQVTHYIIYSNQTAVQMTGAGNL